MDFFSLVSFSYRDKAMVIFLIVGLKVSGQARMLSWL